MIRKTLVLGALALGLTVAPAASAAVAPDCRADLGPWVTQLEKIDTKLGNGGYYYKDYKVAVKKARTIYNRIDVQGLEQECVVSVGVPAEKAMNAYGSARIIWAKYAEKGKKVPAAKVKTIRGLWELAEDYIETATSAL